jgi:hypothetical protein
VTATRNTAHGSTCPAGCTDHSYTDRPSLPLSRWERRARQYRPNVIPEGGSWDGQRPRSQVADVVVGEPRPMDPAKRRAARTARKQRRKGQGR